ncbi:DUF4880 domain-containing protein [Burkholderia sp. Ac-20353]|uniref:FecR family protein n=1 Tax=Burkholderia sp. Ac-20353 TaxID=2703894 RepID=UPI00197C5F3E|nr:DUF4880 domain-containing protein [Burkholderia sp. Ac-20353]MBN3792233.1 DUF4880 domain-containing protein [Burkholderia sp. Ac-20353]
MAVSKLDESWQVLERKARAWVIRMHSGDATPDDRAAFLRWCAERPEHARAAATIGATLSAIDLLAPKLAAEDAASGELWTGVPRRSIPRPGRRAFVGFAVAAGASWLALRPPLQLWPSVGDLAADYRTGTGEQRRVTLADHVAIEMNTQTRIDLLPARYEQSGRPGIELLSGEAEVVVGAPLNVRAQANAPVVVVAGRGRMLVQAARMNVRRNGEQLCVTCLSGSLQVEHRERRLTLSADDQLVYDDRHVGDISRVDSSAVVAWRHGLLVFNDVPLAQVVAEINRYRPGKLILRNAGLGERRVQAKLSIGEIDRAIDMMQQVYGAQVTRLPGSIILLS